MSGADETFLDLALSRSTVPRSADRRADPATLDRALADPTTLVLELDEQGRAPVRRGDRANAWRLALREPRDGDATATVLFLGRQAERTYLAVLTGPGHHDDPATERHGLRDIGSDLGDTDVGLLTTATALAEWHRRHGCCPRCGSPTRVVAGGWLRRCPEDGSEHHPRTDPAVIMAVVDEDDRLLLARGVHWAEHRVSVLAGFVEAGEPLEAAVAREVQEEVGIPVTDIVYRGNQPWPFPASLMLGFRARAARTDLTLDPSEIVSAAWYTRAELAEAVTAGALTLPSPLSIARRLIEEWYGGPLPRPRQEEQG